MKKVFIFLCIVLILCSSFVLAKVIYIKKQGINSINNITIYQNNNSLNNLTVGNTNGNITINNYGNIKLNGNATQWDDMMMNILISKISATKPPTLTQFRNGTYAMAFADVITAQEQEVYTSFQMSHSYKEGSDIYCHLHWTCGTNSTSNVTWAIEITKQDINSIFPITTTYTNTSPCNKAYTHNLANFGSIGSFNGISGVGLVRLYRNSGNVKDTYSGNDVFALSLDCHYEKDSLGSNEEFVK